MTRFGQPVGKPITEAGLHFKTPFIEDVNRFEKRIVQWDGPPSEMTTKDKLFIVVDSFARWRIVDVLAYYQKLRDERTAQSRLDTIFGQRGAQHHCASRSHRGGKNQQVAQADAR